MTAEQIQGRGMEGMGSAFAAMHAAVAAKEKVGPSPDELETPESLEKKDLNLGELNPLIHFPDLNSAQVIESLKLVTNQLIEKYGGLSPVQLESTKVYSLAEKKSLQRFVASFEVESLTEEQIEALENLARSSYKTSIRTRKDPEGKEIPTVTYPQKSADELENRKTGGWIMGPGAAPVDGQDLGIYLFKDLGDITKNNFTKNETSTSKYIVEVREGRMYQTDLVELVTQVSLILGGKDTLSHGDLLYETYYELMRLGLRDFDPKSIYGLEDAVSQIKRGLLIPLASPDLSKGISQDPESVLLSGVPGTGKTLIVQQLLHEETGLFILPIDAFDLVKEMNTDPKDQTIFPRISEVARSTGRKVVLHIDDIENAAIEEEKSKSTLLNLMAGVSDRGFYVIASTNTPEKMEPSLLQPQRFGILIYTGLQNDEARYNILGIHSQKDSKRLNAPLFNSDEEREIILREVVKHTDSFTPRYLGEVATVAKSFLLERVARERGTSIGLREEDLSGHTFDIEDWERAVLEVSSRYDKRGTVKRDKEIKDYILHAKESLGFKSGVQNTRLVFSPETHDRIAAIKAKVDESEDQSPTS